MYEIKRQKLIAFCAKLVTFTRKVWLNSKAYTMDQVNLLMKGIGCGKFHIKVLGMLK